MSSEHVKAVQAKDATLPHHDERQLRIIRVTLQTLLSARSGHPVNSLFIIFDQKFRMNLLQTTPPIKIVQERCTVLRWNDKLAVQVFDNGEVGQFASRERLTRPEVQALVELWR
ncbi:MAG: hypothetical protein AB8B94_15935 [Hyphomicrobiales bacterium]